MQLTIHTDGGARGNPGPAAIGVVIERDGKLLARLGKPIGRTTNNVAEYTAVIEAFHWILRNVSNVRNVSDLEFFLDSALVVNQLNGTFKVKDANLRLLLTKTRELEQCVSGIITYAYVPREQNRQADFLVNQTLDTIVRRET
ncbi:ribonuclease HI family protein [Candidatus Gottesmanbacteria bacterium]|nr:ribonuclease HI family protein [Candidatus Gottesmanbacteria bacterium]